MILMTATVDPIWIGFTMAIAMRFYYVLSTNLIMRTAMAGMAPIWTRFWWRQ